MAEGQTRTLRPLRIGIVAPPWYSVPPEGYGGTELVVYLLARELHARGHLVTLFCARSDPQPYKVVTLAESGLGADVGTPGERFRIAAYLRRVYGRIKPGEFDLLHDHTEATGPVIATLLNFECPVVATVHSALGEPQLELYRELGQDVELVAISHAQRAHAPDVRWAAVVHNAVDDSALKLGARKEDYVLQLGRITPDKGQHVAIEVARRLNMRLVLAGKIDPSPGAQAYFRERIEPELGTDVTWIEDVGGSEKADLLAEARAMLFPLEWEEPFGLAIVEAMASGTPVVAFRRGATPELIEDGVTGFVVDNVDDMAAALARIHEIDTARCASRARELFSPARVASDYERVYAAALNRERRGAGSSPAADFFELQLPGVQEPVASSRDALA